MCLSRVESVRLRSFYFTGLQSQKWYGYIFWFLFNLSICNAFVLSDVHRAQRRKKTMLDFRLELAKQLISATKTQAAFTRRSR